MMNKKSAKVLSREEVAAVEVGHTAITPLLASLTTILFVALLATIPVLQHVQDFRSYLVGTRSSAWPQSTEVFRTFGEAISNVKHTGFVGAVLESNARLLKLFNQYEERLENRAMLTESMLGPMQELLTRYFGAGNEQAYPGRDQWLYFRSDVDYITGPAFNDLRVLDRKMLGGSMVEQRFQPDPVRAILDFKNQLAEHNVSLVIVPIPVKPGIVSGPLSGRTDCSMPLQNPGFERFVSDIKSAGLTVFDPTEVLLEYQERSGKAPYLVTDTHWTPEAMDAAAGELANLLRNRFKLFQSLEALYQRVDTRSVNSGDIVAMLKLPSASTLYPEEVVSLQQVEKVGEGPEPQAEVLLLGDSFANIFSTEEMGWGESAGFSDQLAFHLQSPVDRLIRNGNGAYATREMLRDQFVKGKNPLAGKKVVVWEFAARELASGNWRMLDVDLIQDDTDGRSDMEILVPSRGEELYLEARVLDVSDIPLPGSVPYRDHLCMVHLQIEPGLETVAFIQSMKDNRLSAVSNWKPGDDVKIRLSSWDAVQPNLGSINQSLLDDFLMLESYAWAEPMNVSLSGQSFPFELLVYATFFALLMVAVCRKVRDRVLWIGIGSICSIWLLTAVFMLSSIHAIGDEDPEGSNEIPAKPLSVVEGNGDYFSRWCFNRASLAKADDEKVIRGADDWLFLPAELRHLGVGRFWGNNAAQISKASKPEYADPLPGILDFNMQLREAGVELWMVPVPPKSVIYPDQLQSSSPFAVERLDSNLKAFYHLLDKEGVRVFDMTDSYLAARGGQDLYCHQDSHWAGPAMDMLVSELGSLIKTSDWYNQRDKHEFLRKDIEIPLTGDLWQMLESDQPERERIELKMIINPETGQPPLIDKTSPVLLLGDSHTLVFHRGGDMHARGAGLADLLACEIGFECDLIGVRGSGAGPARRSFYNISRKNPDYLSGKKVVIWCFSAREFSEATGLAWRKIPVR